MLLSEFRQQYPMYGDLSDAELADGLHRKFYSDIPRFEFDQKLGLAVNAEPSWAGDPNAIATPPDMTPRFPGGGDLPSVGFEMQQPAPMAPAAPMPPMTPMPSGLGALSVDRPTTGAVPVMPGLTQELDLDEHQWNIGGAGEVDFSTSALPPIPGQGAGPFERYVSEWAAPPVPSQDALAPVPMSADPYSGTPDWQAYLGLVVRGAAETGLGMGMALEALPQQQTDETRAFYDEYLTIQPGDRDTAEDLIRRVQRSAMTQTRKAMLTQAITETVRDGSKKGSRDLGIDIPVDTETGTRYGRAREVLRETFPASDEQEQSLLGKTMTGIGSTVGFLPFSVVPGGIWAAGALSGAGEAADRAYRTGASAEQQGTATALGMVPGAIDALSIDSIIRGVTRTPGAAGWLRSVVLTGLRTGAIEGSTEGVQQAVQNVIARATYDPDAAIAEGVPENALVGFLSGGALGAAGGVFSRPDRSPVATMPDRQEPPALDPTRAAPGVPRGTEAERPAPDDAVAAAREARRQADEVMRRAAETRARNADRLGLLPDGSSPPVLPGPNDAQTFDRAALPAGAQPGEAIIGPVEPAEPPPAEPGDAEPERSAQQRRPGETVAAYQRRLGVEPGTPEGDAAAAEWLRQFREQRDRSRQRQAEIDALPPPAGGEAFADYAARNGWQPGSREYDNGLRRWSQARDEANARRSRDEKSRQDAEAERIRARWAGRVHSWMESGQDGDTLSLPGAMEGEVPLVLRVVHGTDRHGNPRTTRVLMRPLPNGSEDLVVQSVNGVYQGGPDEKSMPMYGKALEESEAATTGMPAPAPIAPGVRVRIETPSGPAEGVVVEEFQEPRPEQPGGQGARSAPAFAVQLDSGETVDVAPDRARIEVVAPVAAAGAPLSEPPPAKATSPIPTEPRSSVPVPAPPATDVARAVPEELTAEQPTATYQTAKGSRYQVFADGTTVRDKAARPEHPGDQGIKDRTERTVYLDMDGARALAPPNSAKWRVIDHGDGTASLATRRDDGRWGISQSARNIPFTTEPAVGRVPLELWGREAVNGLPGYGKAHFGNAITAVQDAAAPANAMPERAPPPSEQANIEQTPSERAQAAPMPAPVSAPSADARTERGLSADGHPRMSGAVEAAPADTIQARVIDSDTAITPAGTDVPVRYAVVELDSLIPSQTDEGSPNPRFTGEQPRDRGRAASQAQIAEIAGRLDPRRLDRNPSTADGAPLVGPDGMVDSGNGRVLALRRAYAATFPSARRYRDHLAQQGYPVEGMRQPVLVRINDAAPEMRARIASESNARSTLAMSATEQAMADAKAMATVLPTYRGGEVTAAANRDFVRRFIDQAVGAGDRGTIIDSQGQLSGPGIRRIQAAMLAAAYGDANIVETLVESADNDIKAIGGALVDAAPAWAQMRQEAEAGQIDPAVADVTKDLLEAVRLVQRARADGQQVADLAAQFDMFGGRTISVRGEAFLRLFFRDTRYRSQRGRPKIAQALAYYAEEARKAQPGPGLFGDADRATPAGILENARRQADGPEPQQQGDLLGSRPARDGRDGEGIPPAGGNIGRGAPVQPPDGGGDRGAVAAEPARRPDAGRLPDPVAPDAPPRARKRPARANPVDAYADYFQPGNIVAGYVGHDRVIAFDRDAGDGRWAVTVRKVERAADGSWVDSPREQNRVHSTAPSARDLKAGPTVRAGASDAAPRAQAPREPGTPATPLDLPALAAELRRIAPQAKWMPVEELRAAPDGRLMNGAYFPSFRAIVVAATSADPMNTMRHEAVHALRDFGLITEQEWARLSREAERTWLKRYDIDARYPSLDREAQIEEAIAEAFADHPATPLAPLDRPLWERIKRFFDRLGAWFRGQGFQTVDDVLGRIESGDVGRREAGGEARDAAPAYQVPRVRGTTRQETAIDKAIEPAELRGLGRRVVDGVTAVRERVSEEWRWALADDLDGIKRVAKAAGGTDRLDRELPAYVAARFARHHAGQVEAFLRFGAPEWNAAENMVAIKPGSRGLFQIIEPLQRTGLARLFEGYAYARRVDSQGLIGQGREHNLTAADVQELLDLARQHPEFATIFDEIQAYKTAFVNLAEDMGLVNAQQRQTWEQLDHIPFYRVAEDAGVKAPISGKGLANQGPGIRQLTGGEQRFVVIESATGNVVARHVERADAAADAQARGRGFIVEAAGEPIPSVIENVARNVSHLLSASMKNYAAHLAVADAITIGVAKRRPMGMKQALVPTAQIQAAARAAGINVGGWPPNQIQALWAIVPPSDPDVASVRVAGKQEFYEVSDRLMLRALTALHETTLHPVMKALASVRSFFTRTITLDPGFMIRNFVRDSMAQWVQSDSRSLNFPLEMSRSLKNAMAAFRADDRIKTIMSAGADTGFYANRPEQVKKQLEALKTSRKADLVSLTYNPKRWIEVLEKVGRASEMANRLATYDATMRKTGSQREATFEAMDALDFQMRPGSAWVQGFTAIVPFLNARIQGLYRLGRGAAANPKRFAAAGGMLAVFSTVLALFNAGDDEEGGYNDLPEYIKDAAWVIPVWRLLGLAGPEARRWAEENDLPRFLMIPKPFEVGIIFGTVPERFVQALMGNDRGKDTVKSAAHAVMDTLAFNPLANPVSAVPLQWAFNVDMFRGQPIESRSVESLPPGQRASTSTGATARLIGETTNISPAKMEMAVRGLFGTMGAYTLAGLDEVTSALTGQPPAIPRRWDQVPAIRSFIRQDPVATTKWMERFYELRKQVHEAAAAVKEYEDRGEADKAKRAEREAGPLLDERSVLDADAAQISSNRATLDMLRNFERLPEADRKAATREFASLFKEIEENPEKRPVNPRLLNVAPKMRALAGKTELPPGAKRDIADSILWSNNGLARSAAKDAETRIGDAKKRTSPSPSR